MKTLRDILEGSNEDRPFEVVHKSGKVIGRYKTLRTAHRVADKRDLDYGAIAHSVRRVKQDEQKTTSEGVVVMSDYKLDKRGRKYRAHRMTISPTAMDVAKGMRKGPQSELGEENNPYTGLFEGRAEDAFADLDKEIDKSRTPKKTSDMLAEPAVEPAKPSSSMSREPAVEPRKTTKLKDMNPLDRAQWEKDKAMAGIKENINPYYEAIQIQGHTINDDDWYIVHNKTKKIVSSVGGKSRVGKQIEFNAGYAGNKAKVDDEHTAYTGMKVS